MISRYLSIYALESLLMPLIVVAVLGGLLVALGRWHHGSRPLRVGLYALLLCSIAELGVCRSVYFFAAAARVLKLDEVGFRQLGSMQLELSRREKAWTKKYLAVGTSQTGAIYDTYGRSHHEMQVVSLAGFGLVELSLYDDYIAARCARVVLLYVSEFDLGTKPDVDAMKLAPSQAPDELWKLSRTLYGAGAASMEGIADFWIANTVSLYRHQFIFRGFVKRISGETTAFPDGRLSAESRAGEYRRAQVQGIQSLTDGWFQTNATALDVFVGWCAQKGLNVVVVEGQYHPEVQAQYQALRSKARSLTEAVCAKHSNAFFVRVEDTGTFAVEDYVDVTHVSPEAGTRFAERLIAYLDKLGVAERPASGMTNDVSAIPFAGPVTEPPILHSREIVEGTAGSTSVP